MVIHGLSIACFSTLYASSFPLIPVCAGTLSSLFLIGFGFLLGYHISYFVSGCFFVIFDGLHRALRIFLYYLSFVNLLWMSFKAMTAQHLIVIFDFNTR